MSTDSGAVAAFLPLDQIPPEQLTKLIGWVRGKSVPLAALALTYLGYAVVPVHGLKRLADVRTECTCAEYRRRAARRHGREFVPCSHGGKAPIQQGWQKLGPRTVDRVKGWYDRSQGGWPDANVGIATGAEHGLFCFDVDGEPGLANLAQLEAEHGLLPATPTQRTGGGGIQMFFRYPAGLDIRNSAGRICRADGSVIDHVDIRGEAGQGVSAPSLHHGGNCYAWLKSLAPGEVAVADAPQWLIEAAFGATKSRDVAAVTKEPQKKDRKKADAPVVIGRQEYLALIGDGAGQSGFDGPIYRAVCSYFATQGLDADEEVIKAEVFAAVQAAPKNPAKCRVRYGTDEYVNAQINNAKAFIATSAEPEAGEDGGIFDSREKLLEAIKSRISVLVEAGGVKNILHTPQGYSIVSERDAKVALGHYQLAERGPRGGVKLTNGVQLYNAWTGKETFYGVTCNPAAGPRDGLRFNTWKGLNRQRRRGSWALMKAHLRRYVCADNEEHFLWLMCWLAQMFADPAHKMGTCVILVGPKGCGKSTLGRWLHYIIGDDHCQKVSQHKHLVGSFNKHIRDALVVLVEEALWGGSKDGEAVLKDLVTADSIRIECKGVDSAQYSNFARILIMANPGWLVPAGKGERRYFVLDVMEPFGDLPQAEGDAAREAYFSALQEEFEDGGPEAMLDELLEFDWKQVNLRKPPATSA